MPHSLYTDDSSMEALGSYDHADAEGFLKVLEVSARNVGNRQYPHLAGQVGPSCRHRFSVSLVIIATVAEIALLFV